MYCFEHQNVFHLFIKGLRSTSFELNCHDYVLKAENFMNLYQSKIKYFVAIRLYNFILNLQNGDHLYT